MSKHTPGPWTYDLPNCKVRAGNGKPVATVTMRPTDEDVDANGHLIAAAPDLLAAAQLGLEAMNLLPAPTTRPTVLAYDALRAAIAKAEGRG